MHLCDNCIYSKGSCGWYKRNITECKNKVLTSGGKPKRKKK